MAATAHEIINRALRRVNVLAGEESMSAAESVDALQTFNDMLAGFGTKGIYYVHTTLALEDTVNVPDEHVRNVMLMLADELADDFGMTIGQKLAAQITDAKNALQAYYYVTKPAVTEPLLRSRWAPFDITTGR